MVNFSKCDPLPQKILIYFDQWKNVFFKSSILIQKKSDLNTFYANLGENISSGIWHFKSVLLTVKKVQDSIKMLFWSQVAMFPPKLPEITVFDRKHFYF